MKCLWSIFKLQGSVFISQPSEEFSDGSLCTGLFGRIIDLWEMVFFWGLLESLNEFLFSLEIMFSFNFFEMDLGILLFLRVPELHFHNNSWESVMLSGEIDIRVSLPMQLVC